MNLQRAQVQKYTFKDIDYIENYFRNPMMGSEISCYRLNFKQVLKIFDMGEVDFSTKLLIADSIYGNNTYLFVDKIIEYRNKIYAYTMKYVDGPSLGNPDSLALFYKLSYDMLLKYIETLVNDSKEEANFGIQAFDCYKTNIILSDTGFRQIDCIDFIPKDIDPSIIEKNNIRLMCQTIYDSLFAPHLSTFITNNNLLVGDFLSAPYDWVEG